MNSFEQIPTDHLFEITPEFKPFKSRMSGMEFDLIHVQGNVFNKVRKMDDELYVREDTANARLVETSMKSFIEADHGDPVLNMYVKFRQFMKRVLEMYLMYGYCSDEDAIIFRAELKEILSGPYSNYFKVNADGKAKIIQVIEDTATSGS